MAWKLGELGRVTVEIMTWSRKERRESLGIK